MKNTTNNAATMTIDEIRSDLNIVKIHKLYRVISDAHIDFVGVTDIDFANEFEAAVAIGTLVGDTRRERARTNTHVHASSTPDFDLLASLLA